VLCGAVVQVYAGLQYARLLLKFAAFLLLQTACPLDTACMVTGHICAPLQSVRRTMVRAIMAGVA
jgi:hypothetical protein